MRTQGATRYKRKFHFLINAEKNKYISTPKIDEQIEGVFTAWRRQKNGQSQVTEGNRPREGHSLSGDRRGRGKSGHGKKVTKRRALTLWRQQREGQVGTQKETDQARGTHSLEMVEGVTSQDMKRNQ